MLKLTKIVVEKICDRWFAWLEEFPQVAFSGNGPEDGIRLLLTYHGNDLFDARQMTTFDVGSRDGHLEYMIPMISRCRRPVPSLN